MKQYNGEKAVISLTSWKARINTVYKTIDNLLSKCPDFHVVLVLSEEEFPRKEAELPDNLIKFVNTDLIELIWVYKNWKAFKKVLFTMDKYKNVPIISADDDCIYKINYAEELYKHWQKDKTRFVSYWAKRYNVTWSTGGYATLHPPSCYKNAIDFLSDELLNISLNQDDFFYCVFRNKLNLSHCVNLNKHFETVATLHDEHTPLHIMYQIKTNPVKIKTTLNAVEKYVDNKWSDIFKA